MVKFRNGTCSPFKALREILIESNLKRQDLDRHKRLQYWLIHLVHNHPRSMETAPVALPGFSYNQKKWIRHIWLAPE